MNYLTPLDVWDRNQVKVKEIGELKRYPGIIFS
nr:ALPV-169 [Albatrosspox virus]